MTGRTRPEWVGKTPDARIPNAVRARIWLRCEGRCALTGLKIDAAKQPYDFDHIKPLSMGGEHRETNLQLVLREAHRKKTTAEAGPRAKADRIRLKHLGLKSKGRGFGNRSRKFDGTVSLTARARREAQ